MTLRNLLFDGECPVAYYVFVADEATITDDPKIMQGTCGLNRVRVCPGKGKQRPKGLLLDRGDREVDMYFTEHLLARLSMYKSHPLVRQNCSMSGGASIESAD